MSCSLKQRQEALDLEKARVAELAANGADVTDMEELINAYQKNIDNPVRLKNLKRQYNNKFKAIDNSFINKMNDNSPKDSKGRPIVINGGYIGPNGRASYKVKYPKSTKEYTLGAHAINMSNLDAQHSLPGNTISSESDTLGSTPNSSRKHSGEVVLLGSEINHIDGLEALLEELDDADNVGTTDSHKTHLISILKHVVRGFKKPIQEMNVYLDEKTGKNDGFIEFEDKDGIYLKKGDESRTLGTDMSLIETFVHELIHGATHNGMKSHKVSLARELRLLRALRKRALEVLTPEDLMGDVFMDEATKEKEYEIAEGRLDYMAGKDGLEEFLAMALSNEKIFNKLKDVHLNDKNKKGTLYASLENVFMSIVDSLLVLIGKRERTMRGDALIMSLVSDIGRLNTKAKYIKNDGITAQISRKLDEIEEKLTSKMDKYEASKHAEVIKKIAGGEKLGPYNMLWAAHMVVASEEGTPTLQSILAQLGMNEEGTVQTIIRHLKHADEYGNQIQSLISAANQVDIHRETRADTIAGVMNKGFKSNLNRARKKAIYISTMLADNSTLITDYTKEELRDMYAKEDVMDATIERVQNHLLKGLSESDSRYMMDQVQGLANMMMTGESSVAQRKNAKAIVMHVLEESPDKVTEGLVEDVDRLVSLYAAKSMDKTAKKLMAELIKQEYEGIRNIAITQKAFRMVLLKKLTPAEAMNLPKNYHRMTFDAQRSHKIALTDKKTIRQMAEDGYTLKEEMPDLGLGYKGVGGVGLYTSDELVRRPMNRSAMKYIGDRNSGNTLMADAISRGMESNAYEVVQDQIDNGKKLSQEYEEAVRAGKKPAIDTHVVPVVNESNEVVDFRTIMPISHKVNHLGLETNAAIAVGRSQSHEIDIEESAELNDIVWDTLIGDMIENANATTQHGKNMYRYVDIGKFSEIDEVKDAAGILPTNIKDMMALVKRVNKHIDRMNKEYDRDVPLEEIEKSVPKGVRGYIELNPNTDKFTLSDEMIVKVAGEERYDKMSTPQIARMKAIFRKNVFKVRRDMLLDVFGVRDASIASLIPSHKMTKHLKKFIRMAEQFWKEIVKIFKVDVIIRTLPVLMGNIISNAMYSIQYGFSPKAVFKAQLEGAALLKEHLKGVDRLAQIESELLTQPGNKKLQREKDRILNDQKTSAIKPLVDAGLYQHIVEDISMSDVNSTNRIERRLDEMTEGVPEFIKTGGNMLYMSHKTGFFQTITKMTAYSDFIARYAQYTLASAKEQRRFRETHDGKEMPKSAIEEMEKRLVISVRDAYVNYAKPDNKIMQYLNDMGFVAFTRYAIRIQMAIMDLLRGKPLRFAVALLGQELLDGTVGINPSDIVETAVFARTPDHWLYHPGMLKIIEDVVTPHTVRAMQAAL